MKITRRQLRQIIKEEVTGRSPEDVDPLSGSWAIAMIDMIQRAIDKGGKIYGASWDGRRATLEFDNDSSGAIISQYFYPEESYSMGLPHGTPDPDE
jgi:hypothetical protein